MTRQHSRPPVAVLGLGAMGLPMATRLSDRFAVTAFEPAEPRRRLAEAAGIATAATPAEAARGAGAVLVATRDREQAQAALLGPTGAAARMARGSVVILTSTVGPDAATGIADALEPYGLVLVDAPVSGGPVRAGQGDLLMAVGADPQAVEAVRPVLEQLASSLIVVGTRVGEGQLLKVINQLLAGIHIAAAAEAVALARAVGLDPAAVIDALGKGAAGSFMLGDRGPRMVEAYTKNPEVRSRVDIFVKDMRIVNEIAERSHVPATLAAAAEQLYLLAERHGLGAADDSTVVTMLSSPGRGDGEGRGDGLG